MTVKEVEAFLATASDDELLRLYRKTKDKQARMSLSALTASCRVTDKLWAEMKRRNMRAAQPGEI